MVTTITMKRRLEYYWKIFQEQSGISLSFPEFIECLFSKMENEIRSGSSGLQNYHAEGEGKKKPLNDMSEKFRYDYTR